MLAECFHRVVTSNLPEIKRLVLRGRQFRRQFTERRAFRSMVSPYFCHGVIFEIRSSTANVIPLTSRTEPIPFHSVFIPWVWCKRSITGTRVMGIRWYLVAPGLTWHCLRNTTKGWISRFPVIKLANPQPSPTYLLTAMSGRRSTGKFVKHIVPSSRITDQTAWTFSREFLSTSEQNKDSPSSTIGGLSSAKGWITGISKGRITSRP